MNLMVPPELEGSNFADPNSVSDLQLLSFLGYTSTTYCPNLFHVQEVRDQIENLKFSVRSQNLTCTKSDF